MPNAKGVPHLRKVYRQAAQRPPCPWADGPRSRALDAATPAVREQYAALLAHYRTRDAALASVEARLRRYPQARDFWRQVYALLLPES